MRQIIIMLGKPGSGKDTQVLRLSKRLNYKLIKTGDFARSLAKQNTKIAQSLKEGGLVDNNLINQYVADEINNNPTTAGFITDGYPRDVAQAAWFDQFLSEHDLAVNQVILLALNDGIAASRLAKRGRADDQEETIRRRLEVYHQLTTQVIDYYERQHRLITVDASLSRDEISQKIEEVLTV